MGRAYGLAPVLLLLMACQGRNDKVFHANFDAIPIGAPETEVISKLGPPDYTGPEFHLSQLAGYQQRYDEAARSGSVRYHSWHREIDVTCTVGIDSKGRVACKACGGT
jgi:hypothetical protein